MMRSSFAKAFLYKKRFVQVLSVIESVNQLTHHTTATSPDSLMTLSFVINEAFNIFAVAMMILSCNSLRFISGKSFITWKLKEVGMKFLLRPSRPSKSSKSNSILPSSTRYKHSANTIVGMNIDESPASANLNISSTRSGSSPSIHIPD